MTALNRMNGEVRLKVNSEAVGLVLPEEASLAMALWRMIEIGECMTLISVWETPEPPTRVELVVLCTTRGQRYVKLNAFCDISLQIHSF